MLFSPTINSKKNKKNYISLIYIIYDIALWRKSKKLTPWRMCIRNNKKNIPYVHSIVYNKGEFEKM